MSDTIPFWWRLRAIVASAIIPPLLELVPINRVGRTLTFAARARIRRAPDDLDAAWWVDRALDRLPFPWKRTCLRRAAVLYHLLRATGRTVDICIGVRRDEHDAMIAHAWLLHDGMLYLESEATQHDVSRFTLIAQFPRRTTPVENAGVTE